MRIRTLLCILITAAGSGCITDRQLVKTYRKRPANSGFATRISMDGQYQNRDTSGGNTLSMELFFWQGFNYRTVVSNDPIETLHLKYDGRKHLLVTAQDRHGNTTDVLLRVRDKGAYLSIKRKLYLIPIPFLFFIQHEQKTILMTNENGDLIAVYGSSQFGWILFAAGHDEQEVSVFSRL